ncbi:hypothetical protein [Paenibacillus jilunlii]|uniref:hypothetical protein n=1 Tax=Paenibacillus jilunlii TaxID=682956 RepID=UPI000B0D6B65|nr:hypothetical protein [Paenibacillus jilunlii]
MVRIFKNEAGKEAVLHSYNMLLGQWNTEIQELDIETPYDCWQCPQSAAAAFSRCRG